MSETLVYNWLEQRYIVFVVTDPAHEPRHPLQIASPQPVGAPEARLFAPDVERAIAALPRPCYVSLARRRQIAAKLDADAAQRAIEAKQHAALLQVERAARQAAQDAEAARRRALAAGDLAGLCTPSRPTLTGGRTP